MSFCEVCGRNLRTGRKYCYEHRRSNEFSRVRDDTDYGLIIIIVIGFLFAGILLFYLYALLTFLVASFILPIVCAIILFFKFRKIRNLGIKSLTKTEDIICIVSITLLLYSIFWWSYFFIIGKTFV